ncbi:MAG: hypothetical protein NTY98_21700 [Verrucomicrobia bacterium]|nr:hypothetical protein [Verrucomicrobiota bacterium]
MPFPISSNRTLEIHAPGEACLPAIEAAVKEALIEAKAEDLSVKPGEICFRGGMFRLVNGHNQLLAISAGKICFTRQGALVLIRYRISFVQMMIVVTAMVGLVFGCFAHAPYEFLVSGWLWIFGGNYFSTLYRFPRLLRAAAEKGRDEASTV